MAKTPPIKEGDWGSVRRAVQKLAGPVYSNFESDVDSAITSTASVLSGATSIVQSGLDSAVSDLNSNIDVISDGLSVLSNAVFTGDYDADYKALLLEKA